MPRCERTTGGARLFLKSQLRRRFSGIDPLIVASDRLVSHPQQTGLWKREVNFLAMSRLSLKGLQEGTATVVQAMQPWRHESQFADFMTNAENLRTTGINRARRLSVGEGRQIVHSCYSSLKALEMRFVGKD